MEAERGRLDPLYGSKYRSKKKPRFTTKLCTRVEDGSPFGSLLAPSTGGQAGCTLRLVPRSG